MAKELETERQFLKAAVRPEGSVKQPTLGEEEGEKERGAEWPKLQESTVHACAAPPLGRKQHRKNSCLKRLKWTVGAKREPEISHKKEPEVLIEGTQAQSQTDDQRESSETPHAVAGSVARARAQQGSRDENRSEDRGWVVVAESKMETRTVSAALAAVSCVHR
jgi:hypothetical protein